MRSSNRKNEPNLATSISKMHTDDRMITKRQPRQISERDLLRASWLKWDDISVDEFPD